ncbi:MAG: Mur ligase family protein [Patescibacteria group bacterium]
MNLDLTKIKHVHFIGIGGIGISAIARMMMHEGKKVSGQDLTDSEIVKELVKEGADVKIGQLYENIPSNTDLIVYTIAIEGYDPDLYEKLKSQTDIPIRSYPEMLGIVSEGKYTIAISGTHGKTTTTGMIAQIMRDAGIDPTVIVGSLLIGDKSNFIAGKSEYFVVEACEYKRSFLNINPKILVITNIDADHLDYYKDIEDIKSAFRELAMKVPKDGFVVCNPDDENIADVVKDIKAKVMNYADFLNPVTKLKVPGVHNKSNAAAAFAVASILATSYTKTNDALAGFPGTWRRFEYKGKLTNGTLIYDDYAHHPAEIKATLLGFRELYPKSEGWAITVIFQPHLFSRTKLLLPDFAQSFALSDTVIVLPIYYAREEDDGTISSKILAEKITGTGTKAEAFHDFESVEKYIEVWLPTMNEKDIIVTMGAGEAFKVADYILKFS